MSLDRHELLSKILQTKYELEICEERSKARLLANLHSLLDDAIGDRNISRYELLEALRDKMAEYRSQRRKQERPWASI
jgi:hypothetical protein